MDRRRNDPDYQLHEPQEPREQEDEQRLSAEEFRERSAERENTSRAVHQRQNTSSPAPSEVREQEQSE